MAIYVSLKDLVERKRLFDNTPIGSQTELVEAALRNLCQVVATHYGVGCHDLYYTDDNAVFCQFGFQDVPEELRFGAIDDRLNLVTFLLQHDVINNPNVTSAAQAVLDQATSLGESIASHYGVRFYAVDMQYALEFPMYATHEGQHCPDDLQSFDAEDAELTYMGGPMSGAE